MVWHKRFFPLPCTACKHDVKTDHFHSTSNNNIYPIASYINCNTKYVIYGITCIACNVQYVGCTSNMLEIRIRRHLSDARNTAIVNKSMASWHFTQQHHDDTSHFRFSGIEQVFRPIRGGDNAIKLLSHESWWIFRLNNQSPHSLNNRYDIIYQY